MSQLVKLPSGTVLDLDRFMFTLKDTKMIGKYPTLMAGAGELAPILDGEDIDALVEAGLVRELKAKSKIQS